jgi:hypothetical protein
MSLNHLQISWSFRTVFLLPGQESRRRSQKGPGDTSQIPPLCLRKETRWQRDRRAETAEARIVKRGTTAFFDEANAFLPGHGPIGLKEFSLFAKANENKNFSEILLFSFSNKLEMIYGF